MTFALDEVDSRWADAFGPNAPRFDDSSLIVAVDEDAVHPNALAAADVAGASVENRIPPALEHYLNQNADARLTVALPRSSAATGSKSPGPVADTMFDAEPPRRAEGATSRVRSFRHLHLASPSHRAALERDLLADRSAGVVSVHRPAIHYPIVSHRGPTSSPPSRLWPLETCGFVSAWPDLDVGSDPGPIAVIDAGSGGLRHPAIKSRISKYVAPPNGASVGIHGGAVAATIAAIRDLPTMAGGCSSTVQVYNVWTATKFDSQAFYDAIDAVTASNCRVLNLSLGSLERDALAEEAIKRCIASGIVVVAAVGDLESSGSPVMYPSGYDGVIAVGATDRTDLRRRGSSTGRHMSVAAPGDDIWTTAGDAAFDFERGTSFSCAFVSAAAWLAVRRRPDLKPAQIKQCLEESAFPNGSAKQPNKHVGHGRLDVVRLASVLKTFP